MEDAQHDMSPPQPEAPPVQRSVLERTAIGTGWIIGWRMATRALGLLNTLVLIRLLAPADFGLVALGSTFALAIDTLSELGVENSLVREPNPTPAMYGTAFTLTLLRGLVTAALVAAAAIPVARFFAEPRLAHVLWAVAVLNIVRAGANIGIVDFRRAMDFRKEFLLQIVPRILSIGVTIAVALVWRSYWALIAGIAAGQVVRTLFSYRMHPWRPVPDPRSLALPVRLFHLVMGDQHGRAGPGSDGRLRHRQGPGCGCGRHLRDRGGDRGAAHDGARLAHGPLLLLGVRRDPGRPGMASWRPTCGRWRWPSW